MDFAKRIMMVIKKVPDTHLDKVKVLLHSYDLPTADLDSTKIILFEALESDKMIGCIGFEKYGNLGLLRSLAVDSRNHGKGIGKDGFPRHVPVHHAKAHVE